jgi:aconitate hydratase
MRYKQEAVGLVIIAGKEYGSGSSRDWAAKGVALLGVKAVIAESFERIHRSNLVGMGVLPLEFLPGQNRESLGLTGMETYSVTGVREAVEGSRRATVRAVAAGGRQTAFDVVVRVDTPREADYYRFGGILPYVLRQLAARV